jgi:hypothetical protein
MDERNYGSLEACKRLIEKGIVLETEVVWSQYQDCNTDLLEWILELKDEGDILGAECIPAPSMAEVWRLLPEEIDDDGSNYYKAIVGNNLYGYYNAINLTWLVRTENINPTDALIDLLIWVKENEHENKSTTV